jgi:hypothetical protein
MTDEQQTAIDNLRSGNVKLSTLIKDATYTAVERAVEFINNAEDSKSLKQSIDVIESAAKIVGLSPKEAQTNIQINAINGFEFIEMSTEDIKQITEVSVYESE